MDNNISMRNEFTISEKQMNTILKKYFFDTKQLNIKSIYFGEQKVALEFHSNKTLDNEAIVVTSTFYITKELLLEIVKKFVQENFKENFLNKLNLNYKYSNSRQDENLAYILVSYDDTMTIEEV